MGVTVSQLEKGQESSYWSSFYGDVVLSSRASVLRELSHKSLWENFLLSTATSFAVTLTELATLMRQSVASKENSDHEDLSIKEYIDLIRDISDQGEVQAVDFMAVCSSVLLLSSISLKEKIETLFSWMDMEMTKEISMDQFYISNVSFERGLSYATGNKPCSEEYLYGVSKQWFAVCSSGRETDAVRGTKIGKDKFKDFCTNRHYAVRVLLEAFAAAPFPEVAVGEKLSQLVVTVEDHESKAGVMKEPGGGDEWLANPAWIKTAEKMVPKSCVATADKPDVSFDLEWVHGYRGFDCRNNLRYANADGSLVAFNAAGLGVLQTTGSPGDERGQQYFFGEHTDDVVCIAVAEPAAKSSWDACIVATGEIGKDAAIHLWSPVESMQSLACITGCHPKGVSHLLFSRDGSMLISVGVEYTVAVHCVRAGDARFSKQICAAQGPKGLALHACLFGSSESEPQFLTYGEKHVVLWTIRGSSLKMDTVSLKSYKNNVRIYSDARIPLLT